MKPSLFKAALIGILLGISGVAQATTTYFSDLGQTSDSGFAQFGGQTDVNASDFLTGGVATTITSATLSFSNWDDITHVMTPEIFTNNNGVPGTLVGKFSTFTIPADPTGPGQGTFRNYTVSSLGLNLAANTKYWMGVSVDQATDLPFPVIWNTTGSNAMDAGSTFSQVSTTLLKFSSDGGTTWVNATTNSTNAKFSLTGNPTPAPEPSRALLLGVGAGLLLLRRRRIR